MRYLPLLALLLVACSNPERSSFTNISDRGWAYGDTISFLPNTADTAALQQGSLAIAVRHSNNYEYSNIWLELRYADTDTLRTDTVNVQLADEFGNWYGTGVGVGYQLVDTVARNTPVNVRSQIQVRHIMRTDTLAGIEQIGIIFTPTQQ